MAHLPHSGQSFAFGAGRRKGRQRLEWRPLADETPVVDFASLTGLNDRGVCYAATKIKSPGQRKVLARLIADYYCQIWVNGSADNALPFFPVELRGDDNEVLVKLAAGVRGNRFSLSLSECEDAVIGFKP